MLSEYGTHRMAQLNVRYDDSISTYTRIIFSSVVAALNKSGIVRTSRNITVTADTSLWTSRMAGNPRWPPDQAGATLGAATSPTIIINQAINYQNQADNLMFIKAMVLELINVMYPGLGADAEALVDPLIKLIFHWRRLDR